MSQARVLTEADPAFEAEVPVAIIGAGAAGLVAALACHGAGVEPLVIERDPVGLHQPVRRADPGARHPLPAGTRDRGRCRDLRGGHPAEGAWPS